ncbi:MAG: hypothetical protein ACTHU0_38590 [Kofleriaceae bacterium]
MREFDSKASGDDLREQGLGRGDVWSRPETAFVEIGAEPEARPSLELGPTSAARVDPKVALEVFGYLADDPGAGLQGKAGGHTHSLPATAAPKAASKEDGILTERQARKDYGDQFRGDWEDLREDTEDPKRSDPFGGGHGKKAELPGASPGYQKHVGQDGFGELLIVASADAAREHAGEWGQIATPAQPVNGVLDRALAAQLASVEGNATSDWHDGDPTWLEEKKKYSVAWATENMTTIERHKFEQARWCGAYNTWMPLANASHGAMAELVEAAGLMGFDTSKGKDAAGFVEGLELSLDMAIQLVDAKVLDGGKSSWSTRGNNRKVSAPSGARPELSGEQVTPTLGAIGDAYRELQLAQHAIYRELLNSRQRALEAEGGRYTAAIREITEVIETWAGVGDLVGSKGMTVTKGLATGQTGAALDRRFGNNNGDRNAKKALATAQKQAQAAEQDPRDYRSHLDSHAHADTYVQHHDQWKKEGESIPAGGARAELPDISVGGIIRGGLTLAYSEKLDALNQKLAGIKALKTANGQLISMAEMEKVQQQFGKAVERLDAEGEKLGAEKLRDREQDMVSFGHELDAYSFEHMSALEKLHPNLEPGGDREVYATALACVAKIEKYRLLSKLALSTFSFDEFNSTITHLGRERSGTEKPSESASRSPQLAYRSPPFLPNMSEDERAVYQHIAGSYLKLLQLDTRWSIRLEGISSRFRTLMRKVSGSNSRDATGKQF